VSARLAPPQAAAPRATIGPRRLMLLFLVIPMFNYLGAKISLTPPNASTGVGGFDPVNTAIQALVLAMGLGYTLLHPRRVVALAAAAFPFVLLFGVAGASILWSQSPEHSLRRTVGITAQVLFVFILYAELGLRRAMKLVLAVVLLTVVMGLLEAVFRPSFGFDIGIYSNAIRGVYAQKNTFGAALIHGSLALSFLMLTSERLRRRHVAAALVILVMLVLARSATALVLTLLVLGLTGAWLAARAGGLWLVALLLGAGLVAAGGLVFTGRWAWRASTNSSARMRR
jgi:exopolysaccharide production protein ExoQ